MAETDQRWLRAVTSRAREFPARTRMHFVPLDSTAKSRSTLMVLLYSSLSSSTFSLLPLFSFLFHFPVAGQEFEERASVKSFSASGSHATRGTSRSLTGRQWYRAIGRSVCWNVSLEQIAAELPQTLSLSLSLSHSLTHTYTNIASAQPLIFLRFRVKRATRRFVPLLYRPATPSPTLPFIRLQDNDRDTSAFSPFFQPVFVFPLDFGSPSVFLSSSSNNIEKPGEWIPISLSLSLSFDPIPRGSEGIFVARRNVEGEGQRGLP